MALTSEIGAPATVGDGSDDRPLLIVNADDFGLTAGVCRGVLRAHRDGMVTSTSALVVGPAFDEFAPALRDSGLPVGGHLAAVGEDAPLLSATEIPSLVDRRGRFPTTWQQFLRRAARGGIDTADLRREFGAQVEKLHQHGIALTHLDSHQNLHLWPQLATALIEIADRWDIRTIRLPRTVRWGMTGLGVRALSTALEGRARRAGLAFPCSSIGLDDIPGPHHEGTVAAVGRLAQADVAAAELVIHLGEDPDPDRVRYVSRFRWAEQLAAVVDPGARRTVEDAGFRLGSFVDLAASTAANATPRLR